MQKDEKDLIVCKDPRHANHMCQIVYNGNFQLAAKLAENPKYICKHCGRSAKSKDNLCRPTDIKKGILLVGDDR